MTTCQHSMLSKVARGASSWTSVDLLDMGNVGYEATTVRAVLETLGVKVNLFPVGQAKHVVNVLGGRESTAPYVILAAHGDEGRFVLPELDPAVAATQPFDRYLTPADLASFVDLPGRTVISLGCSTGCEPLARAFLDHGCVAYVGPTGAPYGYSGVVFTTLLFYELTHHARASGGEIEPSPLRESVERVRAHDDEMALFRLFA
jgi:hypothetical protein